MKLSSLPLPIGLLIGAWALLAPHSITDAVTVRYVLLAVMFYWCMQGYRRGFLSRRLDELHRKPMIIGWGESVCVLVTTLGFARLMLV